MAWRFLSHSTRVIYSGNSREPRRLRHLLQATEHLKGGASRAGLPILGISYDMPKGNRFTFVGPLLAGRGQPRIVMAHPFTRDAPLTFDAIDPEGQAASQV